MKQIRRGVFETNSSSSHSISISGNDSWEYPKYTLNVEFGEYGWEENDFYGVENKLSYVLTMVQYHLGDLSWEERTPEVVLNSNYVKWLREIVKGFCDQEIEIQLMDEMYYPMGYIDHQSTDVLDEFWAEDELTFKSNMREFIFNNKYSFSTDNDNH